MTVNRISKGLAGPARGGGRLAVRFASGGSLRVAPERRVTCRRQPADEPVRLDWVGKPGGGPSVRYAGFDRLRSHGAAVTAEQRQLSARLIDTSFEIAALRLTRVGCARGESRAGFWTSPRPHGCPGL